jgi:hypothetical protein
MEKTFSASQGRIGIITYFERTEFPNNEKFNYEKIGNDPERQNERNALLKGLGNIKPSINTIHFVQLDKEQMPQNGLVYSIESQDLFRMNECLKEIDKEFEGRKQTLQQFYEEQ